MTIRFALMNRPPSGYQTLPSRFSKFKLNILIIFISTTLVIAIVTAPYTKMFGRNFNSHKDFTCCKNNQLYTHHYYTERAFWIKIGEGYTEEAIGKPNAGGCNIECPPEFK